MQLIKILNPNQTKAMVAATRRGDTTYFYGAQGDVYRIRPYLNVLTGEILHSCSCKDWTYRQARVDGKCKHVKAYTGEEA